MDDALRQWANEQVASCYKECRDGVHAKWPESYYMVRTTRAHRSTIQLWYSLCFRFLVESTGEFQPREIQNR